MHSRAVFSDQIVPLLVRAIQIANPSKVVIITDENTSQHCLPLCKDVPFDLHYELQSGEANKNIQAYLGLSEFLIEHKLDRNALCIALGGGIVTDIVGYVASSFKRGIRYINVPTTLLAMVDASIGGKTGIDHHSIKNILGSFYPPFAILSNAAFLKTLPQHEIESGWGEVIKHLLINNQKIPLQIPIWNNSLLEKWSSIKYDIVLSDPHEKNARLALNAGHTVGHAIESLMLQKNQPVPHGHAVAAGLLIEAQLSKDHFNDAWAYLQLAEAIPSVFGKIPIDSTDIPTLIEFMTHDKKNQDGGIQCALIKSQGTLAVTAVAAEPMHQVLETYCYS